MLRLQLEDGSPDVQATVRHMIATLPNRGNLTFDEALQQSVGELGRGQRCRFCLVRTILTCTRMRIQSLQDVRRMTVYPQAMADMTQPSSHPASYVFTGRACAGPSRNANLHHVLCCPGPFQTTGLVV